MSHRRRGCAKQCAVIHVFAARVAREARLGPRPHRRSCSLDRSRTQREVEYTGSQPCACPSKSGDTAGRAGMHSSCMNEDACDYEVVGLRLSEVEVYAEDDEPSRFVHDWSGAVVLLQGEDATELKIGEFEAIYVDAVGAITENESVFDVFDTRAETMEYFGALYENAHGDFKQSVGRVAWGRDCRWEPSLLILSRLVIQPAYRGRGRGLLALRALMHTLRAGTGLIAMKPFPLQSESWYDEADRLARVARYGLEGFPTNHDIATAALRRYYGRLGFKRVPRTPYMVLDPLRTLTSLATLRGEVEA